MEKKVSQLILASASGNLEKVKELVSSGLNPSSRSMY